MRNNLLLISTMLLSSLGAAAQQDGNTYAITGKQNNNFFWADIKQVDVSNGKIVKTVFETDKTKFTLRSLDNETDVKELPNPTALGVAACALDTRHNRLYFIPLHYSELRYVDLSASQPSFTIVKRNIIAKEKGAPFQTEDKQITKMVIGADGNGYALSNDGNHLIRFSTGKKVQVEDLGPLIDASANNGISIHEKLTGWGGDMVADAFGNLVAVAAQHHVYSIDVRTRVATHLGEIEGLPAGYTTNGAVVDDEGNLVVSSANVFDGLFRVSPENWKAVKIVSNDAPFNASDMANSNLLNQKKFDELTKGNISTLSASGFKSELKVFPNPVSGRYFNITLNVQQSGQHQLVVADIHGTVLQAESISLNAGATTRTVLLKSKYPAGTYYVKLIDNDRQELSVQKIILK